MELQKALQTIKAVCDDSVANGRFRNIDEVANVTDAFNTVVDACNFAVAQKKAAEATKLPAELSPKEEAPESEVLAEL